MRRTASRRRLFARLRTTDPPMRFVAVKPARIRSLPSARSRAWTTTAPREHDGALAAARKSGRILMRSILGSEASVKPSPFDGLGGQALAALGAATGHDLLAILGRHTGAIAVTALTHESRRLIGALHVGGSKSKGIGSARARAGRKRAAVDRRRGGGCQPKQGVSHECQPRPVGPCRSGGLGPASPRRVLLKAGARSPRKRPFGARINPARFAFQPVNGTALEGSTGERLCNEELQASSAP